MKIKPFKLERYFAKYEFSTKYLLSSSDCDGYSLEYILAQANQEELKLWNNLKFGYTDSAGSEFLRKSIANQYSTINQDEVVVMTPGEANFILMNVMLQRCDEIICMGPAYQSLYQVAESLGAIVKFWYPEISTNDFRYNPDQLEELVIDTTKIIVLNFPHNPTGYIPDLEDLHRIVDIARKNDIMIFSDEMYHQVVHNPKDEIPSICDIYENAISLWGMAKSFGLAGLRFGWLASKRTDILEEVVKFKDYLSICNNAAGEVLTTIALNHKEKFIQPNIEKIIKNKKLFMQFVDSHSDLLKCFDTKASSTALAKIKTDITAYEYCEKLVQETGIMLIPSEMFDAGSTHLRIGYGRENLPEILEIWDKYIRKNK